MRIPATNVVRWIITAINVIAVLSILSSLGLFGFFILQTDLAEELTTGRRPNQFYGRIETDLLDDYGDVLSVGHNSGATLPATQQALAHRADIIEVDVVQVQGRLVSAHFPPLPMIGHRLFRGPAVEEVWLATPPGTIIKFDLKETSPAFLDLVFAFLREHEGEHEVIVSSRSITVLAAFASLTPETIRLLSIGDEAQLERFQETKFGIDVIDGVTIRESLIDEPVFYWLKAEDLLVFAWTVNELERANPLVRLGVDGITTDNLAIMELLGQSPTVTPFRPVPE